MQTGTIARLTDKGFGFIKAEGAEKKDLFFHADALLNARYEELKEGDKVSFDVEQGPKGPRAVKVSKL